MSNQTISSRAGLSRAERNFIISYVPAAFAAGSLIGSILMMIAGLLSIMPAFLGFSFHGLGFALAIASVAILFEQNSASSRGEILDAPRTLRETRRRWLLSATAVGGLCPAFVSVIAAL